MKFGAQYEVESFTFSAVSGVPYYVVVDGYDGAAGPYSIALDCTP